ncbi:hypothetical protein BN874_200048 [Candidatus Contendobacter odensis Run_B_J11]|uniref:Uncharacterized protein n=1 Tax=Candidatus Contendobacter odensis Run_B_J11 TaxID=1400861 RepID=A0A7U7GB90_9GAMM|nr:hypothetical protein BN874_200048 [Candidatus Contendobacter odensis Run_B_J11]
MEAGIGATQPVGHYSHDLEGEQRSSLDESQEVLAADPCEQAVSASDGSGAARFVIDQCKLTQHAA